MAAGQAAHVVVVFERVEADCAGVAGGGGHFGRSRAVDRVVVVGVVVGYAVLAGVGGGFAGFGGGGSGVRVLVLGSIFGGFFVVW